MVVVSWLFQAMVIQLLVMEQEAEARQAEAVQVGMLLEGMGRRVS